MTDEEAALLAAPVVFLANHILIVDELEALGEAQVKLVHLPTKTIDNRPNGKVFAVRLARGDEDGMPIFFLPFQNNGVRYIAMDATGPALMLTPAMDNCSFGAGSQHDGGVIVGHVNLGSRLDNYSGVDPLGYQDQVQRQRLERRIGNGPGTVVIGPQSYKPNINSFATTFGKRDAHRVWHFHTLRYWTAHLGSKQLGHRGVHDHAPLV